LRGSIVETFGGAEQERGDAGLGKLGCAAEAAVDGVVGFLNIAAA